MALTYSGLKIPEAKGEHVEEPKTAVVWKVSPAVSGMAFYNSDVFPPVEKQAVYPALKEKTLSS